MRRTRCTRAPFDTRMHLCMHATENVLLQRGAVRVADATLTGEHEGSPLSARCWYSPTSSLRLKVVCRSAAQY